MNKTTAPTARRRLPRAWHDLFERPLWTRGTYLEEESGSHKWVNHRLSGAIGSGLYGSANASTHGSKGPYQGAISRYRRRSLVCTACFCLCLLCHWVSKPAWGSTHLTVTQILVQVQQRYDVTDFEADFNQESNLQAMDIVDTAQGHVSFRPPTDMRWHYQTPEEYILVMNLERIWLYWPADNQIMVGEPEEYLGHAEMGSFFSEPARLLENFHIEMTDEKFGRQEVYSLKLTPKKPEPSLDKAFLLLSKETFLIVESIIYNAFGDETRIRFSNIQFNQGIDPSLFNFVVPKDAQILQLAPR